MKENDFKKLIDNRFSIVDFYATWCVPCKTLSSILDTIENVNIIKINIEDEPEICKKYFIRGVPSLRFFRNGELVDEINGLVSKQKILETIEKNK